MEHTEVDSPPIITDLIQWSKDTVDMR